MAIEVILKKLGNSMGFILPKEFVTNRYLKENEKVFVELVKEADLTKVFGSLKRKISGQEFIDMVKSGWNN